MIETKRERTIVLIIFLTTLLTIVASELASLIFNESFWMFMLGFGMVYLTCGLAALFTIWAVQWIGRGR